MFTPGQKKEELLTRIFALLADFKVDEKRYEIFKENYSRELSNHASNQPYNHATYFNTVALSSWYMLIKLFELILL